jgi:hypothetical protein
MIHGDPIISGVQEERQEKRPSCAWPVKRPMPRADGSGSVEVEKPCGSEDRVFNVKGSGQYTGRPRETPVCQKHLPHAWKAWRVDSADPM